MNRRTLLSMMAAAGVARLAAPVLSEEANVTGLRPRTDVMSRTPVDQLPSIPELPDPFRFADGSRVKSPADWPRRREELKQLIQAYEYGRLPPVPPAGQVRVAEEPAYVPPLRGARGDGTPPPAAEAEDKIDYPEGTKVTKYLLTVGPESDKAKQVSFHVVVAVPPGKGPFPAIVRGDLCWGRVRPEIAAEVARRGYLLAEFDRTEIVPDKKPATKGARDVGAYLVYPEQDFSASAAWAWGFHRVIDHLVTRPDVDRAKIVATGHSRGGKTVLLAGVMDDRIALTVPNNSGCGGAGCYRYQAPKSEDIAAILKNFPQWFQPDFDQFVGKVDRLPIDQHSVKAAIAPRALLTTEATGDLWANPEGSQVTHAAAKVVYDFLGAGDKLAIHYRPGKHEQNLDDWNTLMDFADRLFAGKPSARKFNELAYPDAPKPWAWTAPG